MSRLALHVLVARGPPRTADHPPRPRNRDEAGRDIVHVRHRGIDAAVAQARTAAGDKRSRWQGEPTSAQQCLRAGLLDEIQIHLVPTLLGEGIRLFEHLSADQAELAVASVIDSPSVTHLRYRVAS
jgi:dihydrofolate reductase